MPITRARPERTSSTLQPMHLADRGNALNRLNILLTDLHHMECGEKSPYFWNNRRSEGDAAQVANDAIVLCQALIDLLDARYPVKER